MDIIRRSPSPPSSPPPDSSTDTPRPDAPDDGNSPLLYNVETPAPEEYQRAARRLLRHFEDFAHWTAIWRGIRLYIKAKWRRILKRVTLTSPEGIVYDVDNCPLHDDLHHAYSTNRFARTNLTETKVARLLQSMERQLVSAVQKPLVLEAVAMRLVNPRLVEQLREGEGEGETGGGHINPMSPLAVLPNLSAGEGIAWLGLAFLLATPRHPDPAPQLRLEITNPSLLNPDEPTLPTGYAKVSVFRIANATTNTAVFAILLMEYIEKYNITVFYVKGSDIDATSPNFMVRMFNPIERQGFL